MDPFQFFTGSRLWFDLIITAIVLGGFVEITRAWFQARRIVADTERLRLRSDFEDEAERLVSFADSLDPDSALRERIGEFAKLHEAGQEIDHDTFAAITRARLQRQTRMSRYFAGAAVLVGFLGTLWGLTASVEGIGPLLQEGGLSTAELEQAVAGTLAGMETAFYTTFAGVIGAIVLGLAGMLLRRVQSAALIKFENVTADRLLPAFQTTEAAALARNATRIEEMHERLDEGVRELVAAFETKTDMIGAFVRERVQQMLDEFGSAAEEMITSHRDTAGDMRRLIGVDAAESVPSLADQVAGMHEYVQGLDDTLARYRDLLAELDERIKASIDEQTREFTRVLGQHTADIRKTLEGQSHTIDELGGSVTVLRETVDSYRDVLEHQEDVQRHQQRAWETALQELSQFTTAIRTEIEEIVARFDELSRNIPLEVRSALVEPIDQLAASNRKLRQTIRRHDEEVEDITRAVNAGLESQEELVISIQSQFSDLIDRIDQKSDEFAASIVAQIREDLSEPVATAREELSQFVGRLDEKAVEFMGMLDGSGSGEVDEQILNALGDQIHLQAEIRESARVLQGKATDILTKLDRLGETAGDGGQDHPREREKQPLPRPQPAGTSEIEQSDTGPGRAEPERGSVRKFLTSWFGSQDDDEADV